MMKRTGGALVIVVLAASANVASAADRMVYGAGMVTCAEWQQHRSTGNKVANVQLQAWIDGFLTGYNVASEDVDFIAYAWVDNYCSQYPLDKVMQAVLKLKDDLTARARR
jgi:opacity protein-like surface antigen